MRKFLVILSVGFALFAFGGAGEALAKETSKETSAEVEELIAQDPDLAKNPALQEMVRQELSRYKNGGAPSAVLLDPAISELETVEKLKAAGATQEEAMAAARQIHAVSEELLSSYGQKEVDRQGPSERERFKEELENRISERSDHLQKQEREQKQRSAERQEQQRDQRPENAPKE